MANYELKEKTDYKRTSIGPVKLSDGTMATMFCVTDGEKKSINGTAEKDGATVATFRINPESNRLHMQVMPMNAVGPAVTLEIIEFFTSGAKKFLS